MANAKHLVEVNKLSKIYKQNQSTAIFSSIEEAKKYFLTPEAMEQFNKFCYRQEWQLANENSALHWTISFALDGTPGAPNSDKWNEAKAKMCEDDVWFVKGHWASIDHDADDLF